MIADEGGVFFGRITGFILTTLGFIYIFLHFIEEYVNSIVKKVNISSFLSKFIFILKSLLLWNIHYKYRKYKKFLYFINILKKYIKKQKNILINIFNFTN